MRDNQWFARFFWFFFNFPPVTQVSIRAPAWGATSQRIGCLPTRSRFNPRSRVGSDQQPLAYAGRRPKFQSALPRGERPWMAEMAVREMVMTGFPRTCNFSFSGKWFWTVKERLGNHLGEVVGKSSVMCAWGSRYSTRSRPSMSKASFLPICSTRGFQLLPRL